jgi:acetolactate synthase-1/2/3 large subunit
MRAFIEKYFNENCKRPLILAGRGIRASGSIHLFELVIEKYKIPVVCSLLGLDALPYSHPQKVGFIGIYGNKCANNALMDCDLLLVLGSRLDGRQIGSGFNKYIYQVDIEPDFHVRTELLTADLHEFLYEFLSYKTDYVCDWSPVGVEIVNDCKGINPALFLHQLRSKVFTADVGINQMWCAQNLEIDGLFITSGGMGAMGYSLPAAIGAAIATGETVICVTGDGGLQINIQELETIKRLNLPIKIVVLNNHSLGMIRMFQDSYFEKRYQSTVWDYGTPDFEYLASAYGLSSCSISEPEEIQYGLLRMMENKDPFLLNVEIDVNTNSHKVLWGNALNNMT